MAFPEFRSWSLAVIGGAVGAIVGFLLGGYLSHLLFGNPLATDVHSKEAIEALRDVPGRLGDVATFWGSVLGIIFFAVLGAAGGVMIGWAIAARIPAEPVPLDDGPTSPSPDTPPPSANEEDRARNG